MKDLSDTLRASEAKTILEVGCGKGRVLRQLADLHPDAERIVGVDVVDPRTTVEADLLARPEFEWVRAPGHALPFADSHFDLVCIAHVLHHLQPHLISTTLNEMLRVLRPGGTILIYEMYRDNQTAAQMSHVRYHHLISEIDRITGTDHFETFTRAELMHMVEALGLEQVEIEDFNEVSTDPMDTVEVASILEKIGKRLDAARTLPDFDGIEKKAGEIQAWIREHGIASPTRFVMTGRKQRDVDHDEL